MLKKILILCRSAPHSSFNASEALDLALLSSAFAQDLSLIFLDDGVLQLKQAQSIPTAPLKNINATYAALAEFGIDQIYIDAESLHNRGLNSTDLTISAKILQHHDLQQLIASQDILLNF